MGGKAKPTKHTAKELAQKAHDATCNKGGGGAGKADRAGGKAGHAKYKCPVCGQQAPDPKTAEIHWDAKHPKAGAFEMDKWTDMHAEHGGTTQGIAVRGGIKKHYGAHLPGGTTEAKMVTGAQKKKQELAEKEAAKGLPKKSA